MSFRLAGLLSAGLLWLAGCAHNGSGSQPEKLSILRLENLGQDESAAWIGRAMAVALETELATAPNLTLVGSSQMHALDRGLGVRPIAAPGISAERTQALVAGANRIAYGYYSESGGRLRAHVWIGDPQTQKIVQVIDASAPASDAIGAATAIARQLTSRPGPPVTRSDASLRAYVQGLESKDLAQASAQMQNAIAADPDFGPAYRSLAELDVQRQDREAAKLVLQRGAARSGIAPVERARIQLDMATLNNDLAGKQEALGALTKLEPRTAGIWQSWADAALARRDYRSAVEGYRQAAALDPNNVLLLNQLGYAATYRGNLDEGAAALKKYHAMRPKDANALDSLGDLYLLSNRYHEAEDYYQQALKLDPNFNNNCDLFKASMARLMTGDVAGADDLYKRYIAARTTGHDAGAPLLESEWLWITGRHSQALSQMVAFARASEAHNDRPTAARSYAQLAIWDLIANARPTAQDMAQKAAGFADPSTGAVVAIARFLSQPSASPAEWESRVERFVPNSAQIGIREQMLGLALLLDGQFQAAKAPISKLYDVTGTSSNEGMAVLVAWCDVQAGDFAGAAPLLAQTPVPPVSGIGSFTPLWFPRIFELRAAVDRKTGKGSEAAENEQLFRKLSGR